MTITWTGTATALSSIAHGGETRGTTTLLRRELIVQPGGPALQVPIISGNHLRGRLRRVGEELLRDVLAYEGQLSPAAAHVLRAGGSLVRSTSEPLTGSRLARLRHLIPLIAVFGAAGAGVIIGGALDVGKVIPHVLETNHITGANSDRSAFSAIQLEAYSRQDDTAAHDAANLTSATDEDGTPIVTALNEHLMRFQIETFPAGTTFDTWLKLRRPSPLEYAFTHDLLQAYSDDARLGGRVSLGHGRLRLDLTQNGTPPAPADWRTHVLEHRDEILTTLEDLA